MRRRQSNPAVTAQAPKAPGPGGDPDRPPQRDVPSGRNQSCRHDEVGERLRHPGVAKRSCRRHDRPGPTATDRQLEGCCASRLRHSLKSAALKLVVGPGLIPKSRGRDFGAGMTSTAGDDISEPARGARPQRDVPSGRNQSCGHDEVGETLRHPGVAKRSCRRHDRPGPTATDRQLEGCCASRLRHSLKSAALKLVVGPGLIPKSRPRDFGAGMTALPPKVA